MTFQTIIDIYTDGACKGNPGPGGWGALLRFGDQEKELFGGERRHTNNRMELMGVIAALEALKRPCQARSSIPIRNMCRKASASGFTAGKRKAG